MTPLKERLADTLYALCVALCSACATAPKHIDVSVNVAPDTVRLLETADGVILRADAVVSNGESYPVYIVGCGPAAERQIGESWKEVFSPVCATSGNRLAEPKSAMTVSVMLYGFTKPGLAPRLDPLAQPGLYRFVFQVSQAGREDGPTEPQKSFRLVSRTFMVTR